MSKGVGIKSIGAGVDFGVPFRVWGRLRLQGYLLIRKRPPPPHMILGIVLLYGPRSGLFLMSEVPLLPSLTSKGVFRR